jgi:uncharacterized protein DUF6088
MKQTIEQRVVRRIYGNGRGWAFSPKDFSDLGTRSSIDVALHRLLAKETIRRVIRGIYDYPQYSKRLNRTLSPDVDQVARALARKFGWSIQPTGMAALNVLRLSTQIQGQYAYLSDGPKRTYTIGKRDLVFKHAQRKESGFQHHESALLVQGLKTLGQDRITEDTTAKLREWLPEYLRPKVIKDTGVVTGWIREAILNICRE